MVDFNNQNGGKSPGGSGGKSERSESGRTEVQDARLLRIAIERGWMKGDRFPTRLTQTELESTFEGREPTAVERATVAVHTLIKSGEPRAMGNGVRAVVAMERQNQTDQHKIIDKLAPDQHEIHHTHEEIQATLSEARRDATYVELERKRAIEAGAHAGLNGSNGKSRPMDTHSPPSPN